MKITVEKQPAVTQEIEVNLPVFRKNKERIALISEKGHIEVHLDGKGIRYWIHTGLEYFGAESEYATKNEFLSAIVAVRTKLSILEDEINKFIK